jgi:hypothetical protein
MAYVRRFRSIDWHRSEIGAIVVGALVEPFERDFDDLANAQSAASLRPAGSLTRSGDRTQKACSGPSGKLGRRISLSRWCSYAQ